MKNNEEFRAAVFRKADEYKKLEKEKRQRLVRRILALAICAVFAVPVLYIPISMGLGNISEAGATTGYTEEGSTAETGSTAESLATTGAAQSTTVEYSSPAGSIVKYETEFFCNGAYSIAIDGFEETAPQIIYSPTEETEKYFSEEFFGKNAVITIEFLVPEDLKPYLADISFGENGTVAITLDACEGVVFDFSLWRIFIPVSLEDLPEGEITFDVTYAYYEE